MEGNPGSAAQQSTWPGQEKLNAVADLLDQNKVLIAEINQNHEIRTQESLQRNVVCTSGTRSRC
jgi:hypothetical protein